MIYHNAKNGFPSSILNEEYHPDIVRIYTTCEGKVRTKHVKHDIMVTHDMFGSTLSIRFEDKIYCIAIDKIIADILEVEHENENLYADR